MNLTEFFARYPRAALAFSGGVDSAYLLYAAVQCGADVTAYYVKSEFQPAFEWEDARRLAGELGARLVEIPLSVLEREEVAANPPDRCYHCKRAIFGAIARRAAADGYDVLLDGTNASDEEGDRPGMRALREMQVLSPLRLCGLTKADIRRRSRQAGLFTWEKPAYACLATRVPTGQAITLEQLGRIERAEGRLHQMGFTDLRVRVWGRGARLELPADQLMRAVERREDILAALGADFAPVTLDLQAR